MGRPSSWGLTFSPCSRWPWLVSQAFLQLPCLVSFLPLQASAWLTSPGLVPQAPVGPATVPDPRLLLPGDLTGTLPGPGSETAGVYLRSAHTASTWAPSIQPGPSQGSSQDQACSVATGHTGLEAELEDIQRQLQDYQSMKQNLR